MPTLASDWHVGQVFLTLLWFFLFFIFIWLLIVVFTDIFRSHDMNGWIKALWVIGIIIFPFLGILIYLIARGGKMHERRVQDAQRMDQQFRQYVQSVTPAGAGARSASDEISRLSTLKDQGVITDEEFAQLKAKAIAS
jgi:ABC-type multidrug transport system fused ATPase/permease subunit